MTPTMKPEIEIVENSSGSIRYLEHGWPSELCRWHFHEEYELHFISETHGTVFVGDYIGNFNPGSLFLIGPLVPHNWISDHKIKQKFPVRDMMVQFHDDLFDASIYPEFLELKPLLSLALSGIEFLNFNTHEAKERLLNICNSKGLKRIIQTLDFLEVLSKWPHTKTLSLTQVNRGNGIKYHAKMSNIINFILKNHAENINLSTVSKMAALSDSAFSRHFYVNTGNGFSKFLNRIRIGQACTLLYESEATIADICYQVGFQNLSNFNRQFLKLKGMTPTEYRKQINQHFIDKSQRA